MVDYLRKSDTGSIESLTSIEHAEWVHLYPPFDTHELDRFATQFDLSLDYFTDALDVDERSRFEKEDHATVILINTPILNEEGKENEAIYITVPIGIILLEDIVITITGLENPLFEKFMESRIRGFDPADGKKFVLLLFEQNVLRFLECLKKLNLKRNLIEQELYNSSRSKELQQLLRIEKSLVYFVNSLSDNELLKMKMKRIDLLKIRDDEDLVDIFEDIIVDTSQALEMSNVYTNILSGTMEAYASIISNNMNLFINRLTIITIVLMVPTLIASFFGMNVNVPLSNSPYGFWIIILVSVVLVVGLMMFFKKNEKL